jgi:DNA (cytosine-5)-methyltransferase 1
VPCEIDPFARKVYEARFGKPSWFPKDIEKVEAHDIPEAEIWCAGSPCQGFSIAGSRDGLADARSGLLRTWVALIAEARPRWLLLENVPKPGFLDSARGRDFGEFSARLDDLGYRWAWRVLDARHLGVPQRRRRVFVVGHLGDGGGAAAVLLEPEGRCGDPAAGGTSRARTAREPARGARDGRQIASALSASDGGVDDNDAQGGRLVVGPILSGGAGRRGHRVGSDEASAGHIVPVVAAPLLASAGHHGHSSPRGDGTDTLVVANPLTSPRTGYRLDDNETGNLIVHEVESVVTVVAKSRRAHSQTDFETWSETDVAPTLAAFDNTGPVRATVLAFNIVPETGQGADLRASETDIAMSLTTEEAKKYERGTRVVARSGVRRLTPRECEALQGFPSGWTCLCGVTPYSTAACRCADGPRYKVLGNAVAVPVVEWIVRRLPG